MKTLINVSSVRVENERQMTSVAKSFFLFSKFNTKFWLFSNSVHLLPKRLDNVLFEAHKVANIIKNQLMRTKYERKEEKCDENVYRFVCWYTSLSCVGLLSICHWVTASVLTVDCLTRSAHIRGRCFRRPYKQLHNE